MHEWRVVRHSLALLDRHDRLKLFLAAGALAATSILDLIGVLLLGLVAALAASSISGSSVELGGSLLSDFGLSGTTSLSTMLVIGAVAGLVLISKSIISLMLTRKVFRFLANRQAMISGALASKYLSLPILKVQERSSQQVSIALTQGVSAIALGILGQFVVVLSEASLVIALGLGLAFLNLTVTVFTVVFFGLLIVVLQHTLGRWANRLGSEAAEADMESLSVLQHSMRAYREVTVTGRRGFFIDQFQDKRWKAARVQADVFVVNQIGKYVFEIGLIVGAGLLVVAISATSGIATAVATAAVFLTAASRVFPSLLRLQGAFVSIRSNEGVAGYTFDLMSSMADDDRLTFHEVDRRLVPDGTYEGFVGEVRLDDVTLRYPGASRPAVAHATLHVPVGATLALVGPSGSGKSTIADIILGVLEPDGGRALLSGVDPRDVPSKWPGALAYVPQDVAILNDTVRRNIALGIPDDLIDDSLVLEALTRAQLDDLLSEERGGLDSLVGEHGVKVSGGQRQRLGIARALYTRPQLIVLDEATSALDAQTEREVTNTLDSLAGSVTLIVVAHRLATVRHADQVAYVEDGRILCVGSFDEVRAQVSGFDKQAELLGL